MYKRQVLRGIARGGAHAQPVAHGTAPVKIAPDRLQEGDVYKRQLTMWAEVVPRTMESSMSTTRLPSTVDLTALSLMRTLFCRCFWVGWRCV